MKRQRHTGMRIRNREAVQRALDMRKAGATFQQIGDSLGVSRQRAFAIVTAALEELNQSCAATAEHVRRLELERLDAMTAALSDRQGIPRVADSLLRIMERRARLLGLDAPVQVQPVAPAQEPEITVEQLPLDKRREILAIIEQAEAAAPASEQTVEVAALPAGDG